MRIVKADCGSGAELGEELAEAGREVAFVLRCSSADPGQMEPGSPPQLSGKGPFSSCF